MLLAEFIKASVKDLEGLYPAEEAHKIILLLCESVLGTRSYTHIIEPKYEIDPSRLEQLDGFVTRLCAGEPIQQIVGFSDFCGYRYKITPDVLIPRPETEMLVRRAVEEAARFSRPVRILDLCTGSGCIAWTLAASVPGAEVVGVDISDPALEVARSQYIGHEIREKGMMDPVFVKADVLDTEQDFDHGVFDLIVSNPPYVMESEKASMRRNVLEYEPELAIFVPDDDPLVFYRAIARWSERFLAPDGIAMTEINESLGKETEEVFKASGFHHTGIVKDFFDRNRFVVYSKNSL